MTRGLLVALAISGSIVATGCDDDNAANQDAGADTFIVPEVPGNPVVPEVAMFPFPADFYLTEDSTTLTGRRVNVPEDLMPAGLQAAPLNEADGFSRIPTILGFLPGGYDVSTLPDPTKPEATTMADATVLLIEEGTWTRRAALVEVDAQAPFDERRALILRAHKALKPNTGYVVIVRNGVKRADGTDHQPSPGFLALRDNIPTNNPAIESQRASFELVNQAITEAGVAKDEVILAWSFHTRSEAQVITPLLTMQDAASSYTLGDYTITNDQTDAENRIIRATFDAPSFLTEDRDILYDANGLPIQQGMESVEILITIPNTITGPRPVIVFGHGFLGDPIESTRGSFNELCRNNQFSAVASKLGFNESDLGFIFNTLTGSIGQARRLTALNLQKITNFTAVARMVREKLAPDLMINGGGSLAFDPDNVHYLGISNGGTFGYVIAATSSFFERAVLVVGGGGLMHFLQRAVQWQEFGGLFGIIYPNPLDLQLVFSLVQTEIDPMDSPNYVEHMVRDRYPGRKPLRAQIHMALYDSQVKNMLTEWVARTADVPLVTPSPKDIWGLRTMAAEPPNGANASEPGALFVYDEKVAPGPITNTPPAEDNDTHGTIRDLVSYQTQVAEFINTGRFIQTCTGACDPN